MCNACAYRYYGYANIHCTCTMYVYILVYICRDDLQIEGLPRLVVAKPCLYIIPLGSINLFNTNV